MGEYIESRKNVKRWHDTRHTEVAHASCAYCTITTLQERIDALEEAVQDWYDYGYDRGKAELLLAALLGSKESTCQ